MTLRSTVHRKPPVVEGGNKARSALTCKQLCRKAFSVGKAGFHRYMEALSEILLSADFGR